MVRVQVAGSALCGYAVSSISRFARTLIRPPGTFSRREKEKAAPFPYATAMVRTGTFRGACS